MIAWAWLAFGACLLASAVLLFQAKQSLPQTTSEISNMNIEQTLLEAATGLSYPQLEPEPQLELEPEPEPVSIYEFGRYLAENEPEV